MEPLSEKNKKINVLFIASEADPLVKAGGLGDVAGSLPLAINELNRQTGNDQLVDIRLVIPFYNSIKEKNLPVEQLASFSVNTSDGPIEAAIFSTSLSGVPVYLVSGEPISRVDETYGADFRTDAEKFIFFSLACLKLPAVLNWRCDILHANDWHTAVAVHQLRSSKLHDPFLQNTKTVLTVHNLPFMGTGSEEAIAKYQINPSRNKNLPAWGRELPLPMGLAAADQIVAVSPTYANEIMTQEFGCDLEGFLTTRRAHITGILNGIDSKSWDPATDPSITRKFDSSHLENKLANKQSLLEEFKLENDPNIPLLVLVSRMDRQKGIDLVIEGLRLIKDNPWNAILLGTGDKKLEQACVELEGEMPKKVRSVLLFDGQLSRRLYASADMLMMPSLYEPCGLTQMIAMRYGTLPVARATGGLIDTIIDSRSISDATGFLFPRIDPRSFVSALQRAFLIYQDKEAWIQMQKNAMAQDFSWPRSAQAYKNLYHQLLVTPFP